jgi:hypothetical protein
MLNLKDPWSVVIQLPAELLDHLRAEARREGAAAARAVLEEAVPAPPPEPRPVIRFAKIAAYADRVGLSARKIHELIQGGLPTVGTGRLRRVDVEAADAWLASGAHQARGPRATSGASP